MMTDETGTRTMSATYTPYGSDAYYAGVTDTKYKFTGQEKDPGSGLYYYGARYYDPELCRFKKFREG